MQTDPELKSWTQTPDSYVVNRANEIAPELPIWRLTPLEVSHPTSILLLQRSGQISVLSGNVEHVGHLVQQTPNSFTSPTGTRLLVELLANPSGDWTLVDQVDALQGLSFTAAAELESGTTTFENQFLKADFLILDRRRTLKRVVVTVPPHASAHMQMTRIGTNIEYHP